MKGLFCYDGPLYKDPAGSFYDSILNDQMFQRYFCVAQKVEIVIRIRSTETEIAEKRMNKLNNTNIAVTECPNLSSITGLVKNYKKAKEIIEERIDTSDIVFIRLPSVIGSIAVDICKKKGKKYLIEVVGCPWDSYWNYSIKGKIVAPFAKKTMAVRVKNAPYVLYVTNRFLQNRYPTDGKSINCSNVELATADDNVIKQRIEKICKKSSDEKFIIGTAAGLDVLYKGQHFVIQALSILKKKGIDKIEYQLIGGGTGNYLRQVARENGVEDQIKIIGQMPHEKVFGWLDSIDTYIQPSRQEGLPRSVIEAMSRGLPCLGANTAGIPELLEDAFIFPNSKDEIHEIAKQLLRMYESKELQMEQAKRNFNEAKLYQRDILVDRRTAFFKACVEGN